jgi:lysophospholipase L1-like esterase
MVRIALLLLAAAAAFGEVRWTALPGAEFEINGLPWFKENGGEFWRLPVKYKEKIRKEVWDLSRDPSGGRIRFRTDARTLAVKLEYPDPPGMRNMHAFGQSGVDLYVDGVYWGTATADKEAAPGKIYQHTYFNLPPERPRGEQEMTLYLSLYKPVKVLAIGVDEGAKIAPARPFAVPRPVVFYGTSITQGGCASRPGMSYQAILGRMLNLDHVNLGFSGNGKGEPEMAKTVAEIDAACFVLDFSQNNRDADDLATVYKPFLETLRAAHPKTPVLAITPIYGGAERSGTPRLELMRAHIRKVVAERMGAGDTLLQLVEGTDLLGPERADGLVDGSHPNDLGFQWMAEGLAPRLRKVLGLPPAR